MESLVALAWSARPLLVVGVALTAFVALDLFLRVLRRVGFAFLVAALAFIVMMPDQVPTFLEAGRDWFSPLAPPPGERAAFIPWPWGPWGRG